jgi:predicted acetyltransferase
MAYSLEPLTPQHGKEWRELYAAEPEQFKHGRDRLGFQHEDVLSSPTRYLEEVLRRGSLRGPQLPSRHFVAVEQGKVLGVINLRFELNTFLRDQGGHIGFSVHPAHRNKGVASFMLQELTKRLPNYGLSRALITADKSNVASQKVMNKCGAHFVDDFFEGPVHVVRGWVDALSHSQLLSQNSSLEAEFRFALDNSLNYLRSEQAHSDLKRDPYWPKWNTPWWHLCFLMEMGLLHLAPLEVFETFSKCLGEHYIHFFPKSEEDVPKGCSSTHHVLCHCALFMAFQILFEAGRNPILEHPWVAKWLHKETLPKGGYNCDERAYHTSGSPSFVSNACALELFWRMDSIGQGSSFTDEALKCYEWLNQRNFHLKLNAGIIAHTLQGVELLLPSNGVCGSLTTIFRKFPRLHSWPSKQLSLLPPKSPFPKKILGHQIQ